MTMLGQAIFKSAKITKSLKESQSILFRSQTGKVTTMYNEVSLGKFPKLTMFSMSVWQVEKSLYHF